MADTRHGGYGRRESWRDRENSMFTDDENPDRSRYREDDWRSRDDDERGFLDRAGDEVRSWFGDDEATRRRELDMQRGDARAAFGDRDFEPRGDRGSGTRTPYGGYGYDPGRPPPRGDRYAEDDDAHAASRAVRSGGRFPWEGNYFAWRQEQIAQFDRDYAEYCRERQQKFDRDFDIWRRSRLTEGGTAPAPAAAPDRSAAEPAVEAAPESDPATRARSSRARS